MKRSDEYNPYYPDSMNPPKPSLPPENAPQLGTCEFNDTHEYRAHPQETWCNGWKPVAAPENRPRPPHFEQIKYCCSVCAMLRRCHVCKTETDLACSDCRIDLGVTVYVCKRRECRSAHDEKCGYELRKRIELLEAEHATEDQ